MGQGKVTGKVIVRLMEESMLKLQGGLVLG